MLHCLDLYVFKVTVGFMEEETEGFLFKMLGSQRTAFPWFLKATGGTLPCFRNFVSNIRFFTLRYTRDHILEGLETESRAPFTSVLACAGNAQ